MYDPYRSTLCCPIRESFQPGLDVCVSPAGPGCCLLPDWVLGRVILSISPWVRRTGIWCFVGGCVTVKRVTLFARAVLPFLPSNASTKWGWKLGRWQPSLYPPAPEALPGSRFPGSSLAAGDGATPPDPPGLGQSGRSRVLRRQPPG
eukprot:412617-Hanusia_phi.AAC.1